MLAFQREHRPPCRKILQPNSDPHAYEPQGEQAFHGDSLGKAAGTGGADLVEREPRPAITI